MKRNVSIAIIVAALLAASPLPALADDYIAVLNGGQENPQSRSNALGVFSATYNTTTNLLFYELTYTALEGNETAAHIHCCAVKRKSAGVVFGLVNPGDDRLGSPKRGSLGPFTEDERDALNRGLMYINVHSDLHPAGEIRGQIYLQLRR